MKIGYRAGYRDGQEAGYQEALADCHEQMLRATASGVSIAYAAVLERMLADPEEGQTKFQHLIRVMRELEEQVAPR